MLLSLLFSSSSISSGSGNILFNAKMIKKLNNSKHALVSNVKIDKFSARILDRQTGLPKELLIFLFDLNSFVDKSNKSEK